MEALNSNGYAVKTFGEFRNGPATVAWDLPSYDAKHMMEGGREQAVAILTAHMDELDTAWRGHWGRETAYVYHIGNGAHRIVATVTIDFAARAVTWDWN